MADSRDLQQLHSHYQENTYYVADFRWRNVPGGQRHRLDRGAAPVRDPNKPALRVDFNRYTNQPAVSRLKSLVLDNVWQER